MKLKSILSSILLFALAFSLVPLTGCQSGNGGGGATVSVPTPGEVVAWDNILKNVVGAFRAGIAAQPPGPKRDALLVQIDAVSNWESFGAAVSAAVAAGFQVPAGVPTSQPSSN